jgi:hypothetical protein
MALLSSSDFLCLWEGGRCLHPLDQGLLALQASEPGETWEELAALPLGQRNRRLIELRAACFGTAMNGAVNCPACAEKLEFALDANSLASAAGGAAAVSFGGRQFRLPTSRDLAAAVHEPDLETAALCLLELCRVESGAEPLELSPAEVEQAGELLAEADPLAETRLAVACSACGHSWHETLDPAAFLWAEIEARARRALRDVHVLASAYHWSEAEILSMSDQRRVAYLEMLNA